MAEENNVKTVSITQDKPQLFNSTIDQLKSLTEDPIRGVEKAMATSTGSVGIRHDGQTNLTAGHYSQIKLNPNGTVENFSLQNINKTNRFNVEADDIIINNHKLNNKLYELSDFKSILQREYDTPNYVAGGLTMLGTILTKAWDNNLKRYVLIRRLINIPMFSPSLGNVDVHPGLKITPNTERINSMAEACSSSGLSTQEFIDQARALREDMRQERIALEAKLNAERQAQKNNAYVSMNTLTGMTGSFNSYMNVSNLGIGVGTSSDIMNACKKYEGWPYVLGAQPGDRAMDCGLFCKTVLNDCGINWTTRYVPYMMDEAKGYGLWQGGDAWIPAAGDLIVVEGDGHVIMSDGAGGCWQAGVSRGVYYSSDWRSLFPGGATGYILTSQLLTDNKKKVEDSKKNG